MSKELKWEVTVDGAVYSVKCVTQKTVFDVYVDGELAIRAPRKLKNDDTDSEYDLRIGGKRCQFVVYDGVPDVAVDGILLGAERQMEKQERQNRWLKRLGGMALMVVSTYAVFLWNAYQLAGEPMIGGYVSLVMFILLIVCGLLLLLSTLKKKKEY